MAPQAVAEATRRDISRAYELVSGPFGIAGPQGQPDFVVMSTTDSQVVESALSEEELQVVCDDFRESQKGGGTDAFQFAAELRARYGL